MLIFSLRLKKYLIFTLYPYLEKTYTEKPNEKKPKSEKPLTENQPQLNTKE